MKGLRAFLVGGVCGSIWSGSYLGQVPNAFDVGVAMILFVVQIIITFEEHGK